MIGLHGSPYPGNAAVYGGSQAKAASEMSVISTSWMAERRGFEPLVPF